MDISSEPDNLSLNIPEIPQNASEKKLLNKSLLIAALVLILLIPGLYVQNLVEEREGRQKEAMAEIADKWAGKQIVTGLVLEVPYWKNSRDTSANVIRIKDFAYFLPRDLKIDAEVETETKYRGIYKATVYSSRINISGLIEKPDLQALNIAPDDVIWSDVLVKLPVSDNKGLNEEIRIKINEDSREMAPQASDAGAIQNALQTQVKASAASDLNDLNFSTSYTLSGSDEILFTPIGRSTTINLRSGWPHPSFNGYMLPQQSSISDSGFSATWKSGSYKRRFPQQWTGNAFFLSDLRHEEDNSIAGVVYPAKFSDNNLYKSSFGAEFFVPVNNYQKVLRSVKYAALIIILTFAAFFLIEFNNKKSVHPFQYGLIGIALILFYTLLLSLSEYIGFSFSYLIASIATISLITWFVRGLLSSSKLATTLLAILVSLYIYLFTILQLQDFALLFGSIGLFASLAVIMHYSRKLRW